MDNATSTQIEFVNMIVEFLTIEGTTSAERQYATPFTALLPTSPDNVFGISKAERLFTVIEVIRKRAIA
jgi:type I restriction enzyme R subunit